MVGAHQGPGFIAQPNPLRVPRLRRLSPSTSIQARVSSVNFLENCQINSENGPSSYVDQRGAEGTGGGDNRISCGVFFGAPLSEWLLNTGVCEQFKAWHFGGML